MGIRENASKLNKLSDEGLDEVSGGYIFDEGSDYDRPYEVIHDRTGEVLGRYATYDEAWNAASEQFHMSTDRIFWDEINDLRSW